MPIKGLTDRHEKFPEIGQIRKGGKKGADGSMGRDLTYFRVEIDEKEIDTIAAFKQIYGDKPTDLHITLAFNEIDKVWDAWYEAYTAGRLVARSDGERYIYRVNPKTGQVLTGPGIEIPFIKDETIGTYTSKNGKEMPITCRPVGRLRVVLPELKRLAYLTVMTTSIHDIINISSEIEALSMFNRGRIAGIPLILKRRPKEISCPKPDGSRARYTKWMLSIEADPEWVQKSLEAKHQLSLPEVALNYLPAQVQNMANDEDQFLDDDEEFDNAIDGTFSEEEIEHDIELAKAMDCNTPLGKLGELSLDMLIKLGERSMKPETQKYYNMVREVRENEEINKVDNQNDDELPF